MNTLRKGTERPIIDGQQQVIGRDPRTMTKAELIELGHKRRSPLAALRLHCLDCCGESAIEVRRCLATSCPSWPFRMGANPWREKRFLSDAQRQKLAERLARGRREKSPEF